MDIGLRTEQVAAAVMCAINRGWLHRLQLIIENYPEYLAKTLNIGAMSLGGRRLGEDTDILACVEFVASKGMTVTARLPGLDSCFKYCPSVAHFLLDRGFDPNMMDGQGNTGLHFMAEIGYASAVSTLLSHGAAIERKNEDGLTACNVAQVEGNRRTQRCLEGEEVDPCGDMEILWFSRRCGYGYIRDSITGEVYFEHSSDPGQGLEEGIRVEFDLDWDDFGPIARDVHL